MSDSNQADRIFWQAHAPLYDAYSTGLDGDVDFYVAEAKAAGSPVLELGCGTGRILLPTAEAGISVIGMDRSPAMLAIAQKKVSALSPSVRKRVRLLAGDMRDLALGEKFHLITVPYRGFHHLYTPKDQRQVLTRIHDRLVEGDRLIFDILDPRLDVMAAAFQGNGDRLTLDDEFEDPQTGEQIVVWHGGDYDAELQIIRQELVFERLDRRGRTVHRERQHFTIRFTYRYEMQHLLELCGFEVEALYGDFQRGPFRSGGQQVWVARKKA